MNLQKNTEGKKCFVPKTLANLAPTAQNISTADELTTYCIHSI